MAYQEFAYFYDEFNGAADYDALFAYVTGELASRMALWQISAAAPAS